MKLNSHRNTVLALAAVAALTTIGHTAEAQRLSQIHPSFYSGAEADTRNQQFYLLGMYVGTGGLGWSSFFNVNGYTLRYRVPNSLSNRGPSSLSSNSSTLSATASANGSSASPVQTTPFTIAIVRGCWLVVIDVAQVRKRAQIERGR